MVESRDIFDSRRELRRLQRLSRFLDSSIPLPGGYRIGFDGIMGLVPGAGDTLGAVISSYIIIQASRLGVPAHILARMILNVAVDAVVGLVPLLGDLFDFGWKANLRNVALVEANMGRAPMGKGAERRLFWLVVGLLLLGLALLILLAWWVIRLLVGLVEAASG